MTPAMTAGITDHEGTMEDVVAWVDALAPKATTRGPYKKREMEISN